MEWAQSVRFDNIIANSCVHCFSTREFYANQHCSLLRSS